MISPLLRLLLTVFSYNSGSNLSINQDRPHFYLDSVKLTHTPFYLQQEAGALPSLSRDFRVSGEVDGFRTDYGVFLLNHLPFRSAVFLRKFLTSWHALLRAPMIIPTLKVQLFSDLD